MANLGSAVCFAYNLMQVIGRQLTSRGQTIPFINLCVTWLMGQGSCAAATRLLCTFILTKEELAYVYYPYIYI